MTRGFVSQFDDRRGTGFVQHHHTGSRIPFTIRDARDDAFKPGDAVEYTVVGGKAGVMAQRVRRVV